MNARKRLFAFLFAALSVLLFTACGKWDYSREAVKAANDAQGDTLRVEFKVNQTFTNALRAAVEDNIQPADVDKAMTMDKSIEKLLTSGYRLDVYALRADTDADQAAAQLADEFVNRLAGCEDEGYISMVKADNGYFYMAVLTYKHGGSGSGSGGGSGSGDEGGSEEPEEPTMPKFAVQWYEKAADGYEAGTLVFRMGDDKNAYTAMGNRAVLNEENIKTGLKEQATWILANGGIGYFDPEAFNFQQIEHLIVEEHSGVTEVADVGGHFGVGAFDEDPQLFYKNEALKTIKLQGVKTIGHSAFRYCENLEKIEIANDGDIKIGKWAFWSNCKLCDVDIVANGGNVIIDRLAFYTATQQASKESHVLISGNTITIREEAFCLCLNLGSVELHGTLTEIEENVFERAGEDLGYINIYCDGGEAAFRNACIGAGSNDPLTYAGLGVLSPTYDEEFAVTIHQNS